MTTTFFDDAATPTLNEARFNIQTARRTRSRARPAYENAAYTITTDVASGESRVVGFVLLIRMPGAGIVIPELGRVTFNRAGSPSVSGSSTILQDSVICSSLTCHQSRDVRT
jgi:hypothetical protein